MHITDFTLSNVRQFYSIPMAAGSGVNGSTQPDYIHSKTVSFDKDFARGNVRFTSFCMLGSNCWWW